MVIMRWCYFAPSAPGVSVKTGLHSYGSNAAAVGASWKPGALIMAAWRMKGEGGNDCGSLRYRIWSRRSGVPHCGSGSGLAPVKINSGAGRMKRIFPSRFLER